MAEVEIGILTRGKPTLGMTLSSLLLQQVQDIRIYIVDTAEKPVINRDDVAFALRLAIDRRIQCNYEYLRERERAFSVGRLRILEALKGRHLCFMDDDIVLPSSSLVRLLDVASASPMYGFVAPFCSHSAYPPGYSTQIPLYTPGALFCQDAVVREILLEYYRTTVDLLDRASSPHKVWEPAFLSRLFVALGRDCLVQEDNVVYHLDYREQVNWDAFQESVVQRSEAKARELAGRAVRAI
ncbi:MAG: glycosyltransferase family A protein [Sphingomonadaceae bacterium]